MDISKIEKNHAVILWTGACNINTPIDSFESQVDFSTGTFSVCSIKLTPNLSISITLEEKFYIRIIFDEYITYKKFEISKEEFESLCELHQKIVAIINSQIKEKAIQKGKEDLQRIMQFTTEPVNTITTTCGEPLTINLKLNGKDIHEHLIKGIKFSD